MLFFKNLEVEPRPLRQLGTKERESLGAGRESMCIRTSEGTDCVDRDDGKRHP